MTTKTVNLSDLSREITDFTEDRIEEFKMAAARGIAHSIPDLVASSPVDTGLYASSWDMSIGEMNILLGNYAPHAPIIEHGARPFTPPLPPLLAWAKRVLQDPSQPPNYSSQVWALARYTQTKISKYGMEPKKVMEKAIPGIIERIKREFEAIR